jgi:hypothetical protein
MSSFTDNVFGHQACLFTILCESVHISNVFGELKESPKDFFDQSELSLLAPYFIGVEKEAMGKQSLPHRASKVTEEAENSSYSERYNRNLLDIYAQVDLDILSSLLKHF